VAKAAGQIRRDRVAKARDRIEAGKYDAPSALERILSQRRLDRIIADFNKCLLGQGHEYRDLVAEHLSCSLKYMVDVPLSRAEFGVAGGRIDIELPLRTERLGEYPLWARWADRYKIRSIIVESKNEKHPRQPRRC